MPLAAFNFSRWIDEHPHLLKPPVASQLVFREARGDMVLRAIEAGKPRDVPIREFEAFYPGNRQCPKCGHLHPGKG